MEENHDFGVLSLLKVIDDILKPSGHILIMNLVMKVIFVFVLFPLFQI